MAKNKQGKPIAEGDESQHYVSPRQKRGQAKKDIQPPLTPMIDVTFQLLIFFLLTAQFLPPEGELPAAVPGLGQENASSSEDLRLDIMVKAPVSVTPDAHYVINQTRTLRSSKELYDYMIDYKNRYSSRWRETIVEIDYGNSVRWQFPVDAYNQARRAGFEKVGWAPMNKK
jgi:biopolymer transport protein ExbD